MVNMGSLSDTFYGLEQAQGLDAEDPLKHLRLEFIIPSKTDIRAKKLNILGTSSLTVRFRVDLLNSLTKRCS